MFKLNTSKQHDQLVNHFASPGPSHRPSISKRLSLFI